MSIKRENIFFASTDIRPHPLTYLASSNSLLSFRWLLSLTLTSLVSPDDIKGEGGQREEEESEEAREEKAVKREMNESPEPRDVSEKREG
jgi:hypothetical protein